MFNERMDASLDEIRKVMNNLKLHDVLSRKALANQRRPGAQFLRAILDLRHIADAHRRASARTDYNLAELLRGRDAAERSKPQFLRSGDHAPARRFDILALQSRAHIENGEVVRGELLRI